MGDYHLREGNGRRFTNVAPVGNYRCSANEILQPRNDKLTRHNYEAKDTDLLQFD